MIHLKFHFSTYYVLLNGKRMTNNFDDSVNVIRKNPKVRIKNNDTLDRYMRLP